MAHPGLRTVVVTGGNRGIGLEICRQLAGHGLRVALTARREAEGAAAARRLQGEGLEVSYFPLDVGDGESIARFARHAREAWGRVHALVNNAGIALDGFNAGVARNTLAVNFFGAMHLTDALRPLMDGPARIVMVSSGQGALSCLSRERQRLLMDPSLERGGLIALMNQFVQDVEDGSYRRQGWPGSAYSVSKVGLNALTRILARELDGTGIRVNAVCPGWVRTGMGGRAAPNSPAEGADTPVWAALLPGDGPSGGFFRNRREIAW